MKIASIQLNIEWEDKEVNFRRSETFIERAKSDNCHMVVFPETFNSGFSMNVRTIGEGPKRETFDHSNWPLTRQEQWEALLKARAIKNQCFMVGVNRIGTDGNGLVYRGGSSVFSPLGIMLSHGGKHQEYIITEINESEVTDVRSQFPFLQDIDILPNRLGIGLTIPIEAYPNSAIPSMGGQLSLIQLAEQLGFKAVWLRDIPFNVPAFGDVGQIYDPWVYLGVLAATNHANIEKTLYKLAKEVLPEFYETVN